MISAILKLILGIMLIILAFVLGPLIGIWSINILGQYLWPNHIVPYTLETWAAFGFLLGAPTGLRFGLNRKTND